MAAEPKYSKCEDIALEAERLLDEGHREAATIVYRRVADTCVFGPAPCPGNSDCRVAVARIKRRLEEDSGE